MLKDVWYPTVNSPHNKYKVQVPLPGNKIDENEWIDQFGIRYYLSSTDILFIHSKDYFPDSIFEHINLLPDDVKVIVFELSSGKNELAGFNMLCDSLSRISTCKNIVLSICDLEFGQGMNIDFESLPNNVKISNLINRRRKNERDYYGDNSFDWWCLNLDPITFDNLLSKTTIKTRDRMIEMRMIAKKFYDSFPKSVIESLSDYQKAKYAFLWCSQNTEYDKKSTNPDGSLISGCEYSQDPIQTFKRGLGVCSGRARLMKVLLNNYYMRVPCFLTRGFYGRLQHEWNEVYDGNRTWYYDLSFGIKECPNIESLNTGHRALNHEDINLYLSSMSNNKNRKKSNNNV